MLQTGDIIAGRYRLTEHLGDGGAASVWKAEDSTLEREVAIKFLYAQDERYRAELEEQFLREARLASAVKHRNVIHTMDFGRTESGQAYMVMELLQGHDLGERMGQAPPLPLEQSINIMAQVLRGLSAVHEAGIVHRDLKPENIYLDSNLDSQFPKILDFGIAKSTDKRSGRRSVLTTKEGVLVGTPEYMSPEQARGVPDLDGRSDLWSAGVILFELLAGKLPFDHAYSGELIIQIATTDAPRLDAVRPEIGKPLADVVAKALARNRDERFPTAQEMLDAMLAAVEGGISPQGVPRSPLPTSRRANARTWASLVGAGALIALGVAFLPDREVSRASVASPPVERAPAKPATVLVELHDLPEGATVLVNGRPTQGSPLTLPNDTHSRLLEVQAPGREAWRVMHPAGNNASYAVRMPLRSAPDGGAALAARAAVPAASSGVPSASATAPAAKAVPSSVGTSRASAPDTASAQTVAAAGLTEPVARPRAPAPSRKARATGAAVQSPQPAAPSADDAEEIQDAKLPKAEVFREVDF